MEPVRREVVGQAVAEVLVKGEEVLAGWGAIGLVPGPAGSVCAPAVVPVRPIRQECPAIT